MALFFPNSLTAYTPLFPLLSCVLCSTDDLCFNLSGTSVTFAKVHIWYCNVGHFSDKSLSKLSCKC